MKKRYEFTLEQVEDTLILKSWWAALFILPLAKRITLFIANYTEIKPNSITGFSVTARFFSAFFFLMGGHMSLIAGAFIFQMAYLADCIDGPVARLKGTGSVSGRYFDHISDMLGDIIILMALSAGQRILLSPIIIAMICLHFCEYYITYIVNVAMEKNNGTSAHIPGISDNRIIRIFTEYREKFFRKNFKSFLSLPDYEAFVFFICPVAGIPVAGITVGLYLLIIVVLYKVLSSFVTLHTGEKYFP